MNIVPIERPAAITRPIWKRDTAPAPAAVISGTTPSTIAAVVIRIGRSRIDGRLLDGFALGAAGRLQVVGELHDQDAVLADQAHQRDQPDLGIDVERGAADADADEDQRAGDRHRHRNQNDDRIAEAFEQRGQRQEDDDQREAESGDEAARLLHVLPAQAAVIDRIVARQRARGEVLQVGKRIALRDARHRHALDGGAVELLKVIERFRHRLGRHRRDGRQRHQRAVGGANVVVEQLLRD